MHLSKSFRDLTRFECCLWVFSLCGVTLSFLLAGSYSALNLTASLIGVTALIFVAKGYVLGQILTVVFSIFYGLISFYFRYYGEMITYLCMTAPMAVLAVISWAKNPYKAGGEVKVHHISRKNVTIMLISTVLVTAAFYFILKALGNANLLFSTVSVTTSFLASYLTFFRSPYYAAAYAANDIVLIILWVLATLENPAYLTMVLCFAMFLINDLYGFTQWKRMAKRQARGEIV